VRVGSRRYARENGTFGVTTIQRRHVKLLDCNRLAFDFPGKSGSRWRFELRDPDIVDYLGSLPRGRASRRVLGYDDDGTFQPIGASAVNEYLREIAGMDASVKDLRTWRGTSVAAASLAASLEKGLKADAAWKKAVDDASDWLNNTPAVARGSYVDPLLLEAYRVGRTATTDAGVVELLTEMRQRNSTVAQRE
jgi:DNA topoisomerase-1